MCGEKFWCPLIAVLYIGSPPRVRGKGGKSHRSGHTGGITPACAGKSELSRCRVRLAEDHPRVCGEKLLDEKLKGVK